MNIKAVAAEWREMSADQKKVKFIHSYCSIFVLYK